VDITISYLMPNHTIHLTDPFDYEGRCENLPTGTYYTIVHDADNQMHCEGNRSSIIIIQENNITFRTCMLGISFGKS
jgi:hypothetical protein